VTTGSPRTLLLIGGSSEIGGAIAEKLAAQAPLRAYLLGRDRSRLVQASKRLTKRGAQTDIDEVDAEDRASHQATIDRAFDSLGRVELVVVAVGVLGAQDGLDADTDEALKVMDVNFVGTGSLLLRALRKLREQGAGTLIVLSSVAAERPRASNAIYGAAKAGLDALAQGLADSCAGSGVRVLVVRPGFVNTRMTAGLDPAPFATTPEAVADATLKALNGNAHTVWVPNQLRLIFSALRHLPRPIFRRLPL